MGGVAAAEMVVLALLGLAFLLSLVGLLGAASLLVRTMKHLTDAPPSPHPHPRRWTDRHPRS